MIRIDIKIKNDNDEVIVKASAPNFEMAEEELASLERWVKKQPDQLLRKKLCH